MVTAVATDGDWVTITMKDGLAHNGVLSLAADADTSGSAPGAA